MGKWKCFCRKTLIVMIACFLTITGTLSNGVPVRAAEGVTVNYEIYPIPHEITYGDSQTAITKNVNVVFEQSIDDATKKRANEIVSSIDGVVEVSDNVVEGKSNILVGTYNSEGFVDTYVKENFTIDTKLFEKKDANVVIADKGNLIVLGKDTDAAFFGLTSLKHVFKQLENGEIRDFKIMDYADTSTRGFIEGYYGIPWSNDDRKSLMTFGGDIKMTSYIFAPKDDPFHSGKWRELYPADKLAEIGSMAKVGNDTKCKFVWTIHPFMNGGITEASYDSDILKIKAKFEQLYSVGVRQFGVLGDDAGSLPRSVVIRVMADLQKWVDDKGDVYNLVFCPGGYNNSWWAAGELSEYDKGFDKDIQIFWTGNSVCAPIIQGTLDNFKRRELPAGDADRRSPLFWLNWPVNDINMSRLMMGKGSLLHTDINIDDLSGAVANPMQDAEPSKVALFAIADYTWNVKAFNEDKSWEDSFKYIDANAGEELHTLAKHMSDPAPNGHGLVLEESEQLKPFLDEFKTKLTNGESVKVIGQKLIDEYNIIINACDEFQAKSQNARLKEQILPFGNALKDLSYATISFIKTAIALEDGDNNLVWENYSEALAKMDQSNSHYRPTISGTTKALPGSKRLRPFAESVKSSVAAAVGSILDPSKIIAKAITNREDTPTNGLDSIIDGNKGTAAIFRSPASSKQGEFLGVTYNNSVHLKDVNFYIGNADNAKDFFSKSKVQYTEDGKNWIDINDKIYANTAGDIRIKDLDLNVKGVRVIATQDTGNIWVSLKEIVINETVTKPDDGSTIIPNTVFATAGYVSWSGAIANITDRDDNTFVWYKTPGDSSNAGDFIGVDLSKAVKIGNIHFTSGGTSGTDYWTNYDLEYSVDGVEYTKLESYTQSAAKKTVDYDATKTAITARYVRLRNTVTTGKWVQISELHVDKASILKAYTNAESCMDISKTETLSKTALEATDNITLKPNEYVGVALARIKDLSEINTIENDKLTLESSKNSFVWETVKNPNKPEDAKYVRLLNKGDSDVTFNLTKFEVLSNEVEPKSLLSSNMGTPGNPLALFDKDRTTKTQFASSQILGRNFVYDLGQTIDLHSFKVVCHDGEWDFPRHGKFSVSEDGKIWKEILLLGNQDADNENESTNADVINSVLPVHETSYNTKEARDINLKARYLKFEITRTKAGGDKWIQFSELEINDGAYIPSENDPTISTTAPIIEGKEPKYMVDGDVSTVFTPGGSAAGEVVYNITSNPKLSQITILQSPSTVSNAVVSVLAPSRTKETTYEWQELGMLNLSLNQFAVSSYGTVLAIKIAWAENSVPTLNEIFTLENTSTAVDKTFLLKTIEAAEAIDAELYTTSSYQAMNALLADAKAVYEKEDATQNQVTKAETDLNKALTGLLTRADTNALREEIKKAADLNKSTYTEATWTIYETALNAAKAAVKDNSDVSQVTADALLKGLKDAFAGLKEDTVLSKTILKSAIDKANSAEASGQLDKLAPNAAALIRRQLRIAVGVYANADATIKECMDAWLELATALHYLDFVADKEALSQLIASCENIKIEDYVEGVEEYVAALANAKTVYANINALQDSINAAYKRLDNAILGLVLNNVDKKALQFMVDSIKETIGDGSKYKQDANWQTFKTALDTAERVLADKDAKEVDVTNAMSALANAYLSIRLLPSEELLSQLTAFLNVAGAINRALYTAEQLFIIDGTVEEAKAMLANFDDEAFPQLQTKMATALEIINSTLPQPDAIVETPKKDVTNTGDSTNTALLWTAMLAACGMVLESIRRKRQRN